MTTSGKQKSRRPLTGIRVLDLTRVVSGPFCSMILGDLGAEIIKAEEIEKGDPSRAVEPLVNGASSYDLVFNRNKKSIAIDVRTDAGRELILDLAKNCDVVLDNFRPDVMDRLGLSVRTLRTVNPRLIICSISGYGKGNSLSNQPSFDIIAQALSGMMSINGESDGGPLKLGIPLGDLGAGMWAAMGVLAALQGRNTTGQAAEIDVSMLDCLMATLSYMTQIFLLTGKSPERTGNGSDEVVPYGRFPAKDGNVILALNIGSFWRKFCEAIGHPEWIEDVRFRKATSRRQNRIELELAMSEVLKTKTVAEWGAIFDRYDIPHAAVLDIGEALSQPIVAERNLIRECEHPQVGKVRLVGSPLKFGENFDDPDPTAAPLLGQHTAEVLSEILKLDEAKLQELAQAKVIRR